MGKWNIRCRVVGKGVRFVDVGDWILDIGFWEKRFTVCGCNGQMEYYM